LTVARGSLFVWGQKLCVFLFGIIKEKGVKLMNRVKEFMSNVDDGYFVVAFAIVFLAITLVWAMLYDTHLDNRISGVINNPTFVGEVVNKESITRRVGSMTAFNQITTHQLHIIGEYMEGNEVMQVDQVFTVTRRWFSKFEIGDLIYNPSQ